MLPMVGSRAKNVFGERDASSRVWARPEQADYGPQAA